LLSRLTSEQMERLDKVSNPEPNEIPFPHTFNSSLDIFLGKSIEIPKKFQPIMNLKVAPMF
jgi:hypothetical protein